MTSRHSKNCLYHRSSHANSPDDPEAVGSRDGCRPPEFFPRFARRARAELRHAAGSRSVGEQANRNSSRLAGAEIRTGSLAGGGNVTLRPGQNFIITTAKILGDSTRVNTTFKQLPREVKSGDRILLSDGLIELKWITCEAWKCIARS